MMLHDYLYGDGYDYDSDGFYVPAHEYYRWKRQEELRRRWELEQAYRREQQERYLRNLRRREDEQERQMRRRRELELHDAVAEHNLLNDEEEETKQGAQPKYQLVRGIDGLIYCVPIPRAEKRHVQSPPSLRRPKVEKVSTQFKSKESHDDLSHSPEPAVSRKNSMRADSKVTSKATLDDDSRDRVVVDVRVPEAKEPKKGRNRRKVTVVVENASDSEDENDEFKSVWRNRRPSPGQWIEPVEF